MRVRLRDDTEWIAAIGERTDERGRVRWLEIAGTPWGPSDARLDGVRVIDATEDDLAELEGIGFRVPDGVIVTNSIIDAVLSIFGGCVPDEPLSGEDVARRIADRKRPPDAVVRQMPLFVE